METKTCEKPATVTRQNLSNGDVKSLVNVIQGYNISVGRPQSSKQSFSQEIRDSSQLEVKRPLWGGDQGKLQAVLGFIIAKFICV